MTNQDKKVSCFGCKHSHPLFHWTRSLMHISCDKLKLEDIPERLECPDGERFQWVRKA